MRPQDRHDPGGRVRLALPDGMAGDARFSPCGHYRYAMSRDWTPPGTEARTILWCGMNPSTADASVNDPTCNREVVFSRDWGFTRYLKVNMLGWRATRPADLPSDPETACGPDNLAIILEMARESEIVIAAYGRLPKRYHGIIDATLGALRDHGSMLFCLGTNKDGSAKHPLYLPRIAERQPF